MQHFPGRNPDAFGGSIPILKRTGNGRTRYTHPVGERFRRFRHDALYFPLRALFGAGSRLPLAVVRGLCAQLGLAALGFPSREWRRAADHLALAFPELEGAARRRLLRRCALHFGRTLGEVVWLWRARPEQVAALCSITGIEHLERALDGGRGAVLITGHCGNWELLNARLGVAGVPMTIAVRELFDPRLDTLITALRARFGTAVVPRGSTAGRRLAQALLGNRVDGLLIDQDIRGIPGVFVPFFGRPAWTPSGAATLALRAGCATVPAFVHRRADGTHHAEVHPPLTAPTEGSNEERVAALTAASTAAIERQVRAFPEQWVWMHRRWRTRPEEGSSDD